LLVFNLFSLDRLSKVLNYLWNEEKRVKNCPKKDTTISQSEFDSSEK